MPRMVCFYTSGTEQDCFWSFITCKISRSMPSNVISSTWVSTDEVLLKKCWIKSPSMFNFAAKVTSITLWWKIKMWENTRKGNLQNNLQKSSIFLCSITLPGGKKRKQTCILHSLCTTISKKKNTKIGRLCIICLGICTEPEIIDGRGEVSVGFASFFTLLYHFA